MSGEDRGPPLRARSPVTNARGLHARAAARFVQQATQFSAEIAVSFGGQTVSGRSILGLMMLGAAEGAILEIEASGSDAQAAIERLTALVASGFDENEPAPAAGGAEKTRHGRRSDA